MGEWFASTAYSGSLLLAVPVAIVAGLVSFFSPCVIPLLPGYLSYATGLSAVDATARERLVLLDIGHGDTVAIEIFAADPPDWDSYVAEAMRIVESMQFAEPVASN